MQGPVRRKGGMAAQLGGKLEPNSPRRITGKLFPGADPQFHRGDVWP